MKRPQVSIITCTHNPRAGYLARVIAALRAQSAPQDQWEYLLVDNASTSRVCRELDLAWHARARYVTEPNLGLTPARLRGIREAAGEILVFVDDDNILDESCIEDVIAVGREHERVGAWGGQIVPEFEESPSPSVQPYLGALALRRVTRDQWSNLPWLSETMPCGAGMCVRMGVARHYLMLHAGGKRKFVLDRVGTNLLSGGDNDLALCACDLGLGVGMFARLQITHLIPKERLSMKYLLALLENIAFSSEVLAALRPEARQQSAESKVREVYAVFRALAKPAFDRSVFFACRRGRARALQMLAGRSGTCSLPHSAIAASQDKTS